MTVAAEERAEVVGEHTGGYAIEIEGLNAGYERTSVLRNLSMHVPRGSIYGLTGPRGAGKTTTIRILATLHQPTTGRACVDGIDVVASPRAVRGRVGYLPDVSGTYDALTVSEYMDFYAAIFRISASRRRKLTDELLELVSLTEQRNTPVQWLSRGMKQQLGVARCLIHDPPVLLLDDPASGMDPHGRIELREMLVELARGLNKTIVIGSHLPSDFAGVCTHLGIMRGGALVAEGSVDEIVTAVSPSARLRLSVRDPGHRLTARSVLESHPACRRIEVDGTSTLLADFTGTDADVTGVLGSLVTARVGVEEFVWEHPDLEEIFLRVMEVEA